MTNLPIHDTQYTVYMMYNVHYTECPKKVTKLSDLVTVTLKLR